MCATKQPTKTASEPVLTWKEGVSISVDHHTLDWRQVISDPSGCHDPKLATLTHTCKINKKLRASRIPYLCHQNFTKNVLTTLYKSKTHSHIKCTKTSQIDSLTAQRSIHMFMYIHTLTRILTEKAYVIQLNTLRKNSLVCYLWWLFFSVYF